jgi:hypothetical protein
MAAQLACGPPWGSTIVGSFSPDATADRERTTMASTVPGITSTTLYEMLATASIAGADSFDA